MVENESKVQEQQTEKSEIVKKTEEKLNQIKNTLSTSPDKADQLTSLIDQNFRDGLKKIEKSNIKSVVDTINSMDQKNLDEKDKSALTSLNIILSPYIKKAGEGIIVNKGKESGYNATKDARKFREDILARIKSDYKDIAGIDTIEKALNQPSKQNIQSLQNYLLTNLPNIKDRLSFYQSSWDKNATQIPDSISKQPDGGFGPGTQKALTTYLDNFVADNNSSEIYTDNIIRQQTASNKVILQQTAQSKVDKTIIVPEGKVNKVAVRNFTDNMGDIGNIIKSYGNLNSTYNKILSLEKDMKQNNLKIIKLKGTLTENTQKQKETKASLDKIISSITGRGGTEQEQITIRDLDQSLKNLKNEANTINEDIAKFSQENEDKIAQNIVLVSEFQQGLQELQKTYLSDQNILRQNIDKIDQSKIDLLNKQKNALATTDANLTKINNLLGENGTINNYLAQFNTSKGVEQQTSSKDQQIAAKTDKQLETVVINEITPENITERLSKIDPSELFEGDKNGEGQKIFDYIHNNRQNPSIIPNNIVSIFKSKLHEKYPDLYDGNQNLRKETIEGDNRFYPEGKSDIEYFNFGKQTT